MKRRSKHGYIGTARIINHDSGKAANLERTASHEPVATCEGSRFTAPINVLVHSYRTRLADPDGVSAKYVIDACVHFGLISDDSAKQINEVRYVQTKVKNKTEEKTVVTLEEVGGE